jgi:hypothetical protein
MGEHEDFFLRAREAEGRVGLCRGVTAKNDNSCDRTPLYLRKRARVFDFWVIFFRKARGDPGAVACDAAIQLPLPSPPPFPPLQWDLQRMKTAAGMYTLLCNGTVGTAPPWHAQPGKEFGVRDAGEAVAVVPMRPGSTDGHDCWIHVQQENLWWG